MYGNVHRSYMHARNGLVREKKPLQIFRYERQQKKYPVRGNGSELET